MDCAHFKYLYNNQTTIIHNKNMVILLNLQYFIYVFSSGIQQICIPGWILLNVCELVVVNNLIKKTKKNWGTGPKDLKERRWSSKFE